MMMMTSDPPRRTTAPPPSIVPALIPAAALPRPHIARAVLAAARRDAHVALPYFFFFALLSIAAFTLILSLPRSLVVSNDSREINLFTTAFSHATFLILFAVTAAAIGARQGFQDQSPDDWAFAIHRPVSRRLLFLARSLSGLALYAAIAAPTLLAAFLFARSTWAGPFFHWTFLLPTGADALAAIAWYFAAHLAADRRASLFGSRIIPLGAALICTALVLSADTFSHALLAIALCTTLLAFTATASFISRGFDLPRAARRHGRAALTLILLAGFTTALLLPVRLLRENLAQQERQAGYTPPPISTTDRSIRILNDGSLVRVNYTVDRNITTVDTRDMAGNPITVERDQWAASLYSSRSRWTPPPTPTYRDLPRFDSYVARWVENRGYTETWFWFPATALYYGYANDGHHFLGTLGRNGFVPNGNALSFDGWIARDLYHNDATASRDKLYDRDLDARTARLLFQSTPDDPILETQPNQLDDTLTPSSRAGISQFITTAHRLLLLGPAGNIRFSLPLAHDPRTLLDLTLFHLPNQHEFLLRYTFPESTEIAHLSDTGELLSTQSFPLIARTTSAPIPAMPDALHAAHIAHQHDGLLNGLTSPALLTLAPHLPTSLNDLLNTPPDTTPDRTTATLLAMTLSAALTAAAALLLRKPLTHTLAWTALSLPLGLPALLTMLALHHRQPPTPQPLPASATTILT